MRAFNHIGPGQSPEFVVAGLAERIVRACRSGTTRIGAGNLSPRRDFTDVRDVVRAYRLAMEFGGAGEAYNVCSGVDHSIGEVAEILLALAPAPLELVTDDSLSRPVDQPIIRGDHAKLTAATGWQPEITLSRSLGSASQSGGFQPLSS